MIFRRHLLMLSFRDAWKNLPPRITCSCDKRYMIVSKGKGGLLIVSFSLCKSDTGCSISLFISSLIMLTAQVTIIAYFYSRNSFDFNFSTYIYFLLSLPRSRDIILWY